MELKEILKSEKHTIVDVRKKEEYQLGHIKESINIPFEELPNRISELQNLPKPIVLCCENGRTSRKAHIYLSQNGLTNTYNGGSWLELNYFKV